ncbi:MAG: DTW domain-containing protein [Deltaproteobacteria bacterium]|nr:DTW domain-containing protein [Deltaproteobacteria bacterium]
MVETEAFREVCYRCRRARAVCLCPALTPITPAARIVFLQHPREARNAIGTVRLAHLQLEGSTIIEGVELAASAETMALFERERARSVVLYPAKNARPAEELRAHAGPLTVWVLDGTWNQAKKLWTKNPWLHALPAYTLNPTVPGNYRIRKEPAPHCLATIEAVTQLLDLIADAPGRHQGLLRAFETMVDRQIAFTQGGNGRVRRKIRKTKRTFAFPEGCDPDRVVLVHAEGSGHVARSRGGDNELCEWHALRPSTGERFYAQVATHVPIAESVRTKLGIDAAPIDREAFEARWRAFKGDDACLGWGRYAPALYERGLEPYWDLRDILTDFLKKRLGYVEDGTRRLGLTPAADPRRGHRRIGHLAALFAHARSL